ncbi:SAM-dependent methyltransferase [Scopulibacillus cellulosilyticus]|uniref:S-adenosyl-L-methionine-dependent methyltransferase n=1 Tax=Scopulibacillus cellulosilyticus TaxID=2665665 RepID=A0ABW2PXH8_9BACL
MAKEAAKTGAGPTALVAIEQYFPKHERIIEDDLAHQILPSGRAFLRLMKLHSIRDWMVRFTEKSFPGMWSLMMCRKRYVDEKLIESIHAIEAVVNLGAGFDTRAYRLPTLHHVPFWELDQPETIRSKESQLRKVLGVIPTHVKLVEIDFDHEDLCSVLESQAYSTNMRTFYIWEAVTQYLTEKGIRSIFSFLSNAAPGSRIVFTYVRKDFLDGREMYGWEKGYKRFVTNKIWIFGMEPGEWPSFLNDYGWQVIEDIGFDEIAEKYVKPTGRMLASTPIERVVYAEKL